MHIYIYIYSYSGEKQHRPDRTHFQVRWIYYGPLEKSTVCLRRRFADHLRRKPASPTSWAICGRGVGWGSINKENMFYTLLHPGGWGWGMGTSTTLKHKQTNKKKQYTHLHPGGTHSYILRGGGSLEPLMHILFLELFFVGYLVSLLAS